MVITMTNRLETNRQEKTRSNKKKDTCPAQKVDGVDKGSTRSNSGNKQKGKQSKKKTSTPSLGCSSGIVYTGIYIVSIAIACSNVYKSSVVSTSYLILESIIQTPPMIKQKHSPRRFSDNIQLNVDRGLNIVNMLSGQHISSWIYEGRKPVPKHHVWKNDPKEKMLYDPTDAASMKNNDTLFVSYAKIEEFTSDFQTSEEKENSHIQ